MRFKFPTLQNWLKLGENNVKHPFYRFHRIHTCRLRKASCFLISFLKDNIRVPWALFWIIWESSLLKLRELSPLWGTPRNSITLQVPKVSLIWIVTLNRPTTNCLCTIPNLWWKRRKFTCRVQCLRQTTFQIYQTLTTSTMSLMFNQWKQRLLRISHAPTSLVAVILAQQSWWPSKMKSIKSAEF